VATQNHIVTNNSRALNVVDLMTVKECKKRKETPAKCALGGGNHPANYKVCRHYHNLVNGKSTFRNNTQRTAPVNTNVPGVSKRLERIQSAFTSLKTHAELSFPHGTK
jgi:hypothetical protein